MRVYVLCGKPYRVHSSARLGLFNQYFAQSCQVAFNRSIILGWSAGITKQILLSSFAYQVDQRWTLRAASNPSAVKQLRDGGGKFLKTLRAQGAVHSDREWRNMLWNDEASCLIVIDLEDVKWLN